MDAKKLLAETLSEKTGFSSEELIGWLETPPSPELGDYAFPCFRLAKTMRKAPAQIAVELQKEISLPEQFSSVAASGPYLNFHLDKTLQAKAVLERIFQEGERYGGSEQGCGKTVCIDYSSVNIAKPFHIGHLRSTVIGNALYHIYGHLGYHCVGINHLGDWGTQFGKMLCAYKLWGDRETIDAGGVQELVKLYVRFHEEAETNPELNDQARAWFSRIEQGDPEAMELYLWMKELTLKEAESVYSMLNIRFDSYAGESFYNDKMGRVVDGLREKGLLKEDQGAQIVDLSEWKMPPCIILRSDGATLYATRDLAAALYRKDTYDFSKCLYVVAYQQDLHFKQLFKVIELMGYDWAKDMVHVSFGMVSVKDGTLSTRHGKVIYLKDVLNAAIEKTLQIICEKSPDLEDKESAAGMVGIGAVVWDGLYNSRIKDICFDWETALNFDGETGPYVQYSHARACSVLRKAKPDCSQIEFGNLTDAQSSALIAALAAFPASVADAAEKNEPFVVSRAVMAICVAFNRFYFEQRILDDDPSVRNARLALTAAAAQVIRIGLGLLGIAAPERM
jgi:arginyl-tRNA synthetase